MSENWLDSLQVEGPQAGYELAVKLARMGVKLTQPSDEIRKELRPIYENNADSLIAASQVIAIHYQTMDNGTNWFPIDNNLPDVPFNSIETTIYSYQ